VTYRYGTIAEANYYYDNQTLPFQPSGFNRGSSIGRLVAVTAQSYFGGVSQRPFASFYGYSTAGLVARYQQRIDGADYGFSSYTYNRADQPTQTTYPSGRVVTTAYDGAGRTASVSTPISGTPTTLSGAISYTPAGGITSELYGNGLTHTVAYNSRFQPTTIRLGNGRTGSVFELQYFYVIYANREAFLLLARTCAKIAIGQYESGFHVHLTTDFDATQPEALRLVLNVESVKS
jgi:YD repeat-containing protein